MKFSQVVGVAAISVFSLDVEVTCASPAPASAENSSFCAEFFLPKSASPDYNVQNLFGSCSGRGACIAFDFAEENATQDEIDDQANEYEYRCQCDEGWTGLSDFINTDGFDCHINSDIVKYMWVANLVFCVLVYVFSFSGIRARVNQHFERRRAYRATVPRRPRMDRKQSTDPGSPKSPNLSSRVLKKVKKVSRTPTSKESKALRENKALMTMFILFVLMMPCNIAYALLKIFAEDQRIGQTWAATLLFAFTKLWFYVGIVVYQPALLGAVLSGVTLDAKVLRRSNFFGRLAMGLSMVLSFAPCVTVVLGGADANPLLSRALWLVYACGMSLSTFGYAFQARVLQKKITLALGQSYSMNQAHRTKLMKDKLVATQEEAQRQGFTQAALYAVFGLWPYMWNKHDYTLPVIWISLPIIALRVAKTTIFDRTGSTVPKVSSANMLDGSYGSNGGKSRKQSRSTLGGTWLRGRTTSDLGTFEVNSPRLSMNRGALEAPRSPTIREQSSGLKRSEDTDEFDQVYHDDDPAQDRELTVSFYELSAFLDDSPLPDEPLEPSFRLSTTPSI